MAKSSTTKSQRIGIWVIAVIMLVGTIGSFAIIVLATTNSQRDQARLNELQTKYQNEQNQYETDMKAQAAELGPKYVGAMKDYATRAAAFDKASVTDLTTEDIVVGDGKEVPANGTFTAYYIGWNPEGKIFDSSIDGDTLKAPIVASPGGVITGWTQGAAGMKVGGVRELSIPSSLAYGSTGSGEDIPADTPLKFIVLVVPTIPQPEIPAELLKYYQAQQGY